MIVVAKKYGQLGNRLYLSAHLMAAGIEHGVDVANPCFAEYAHLFPATSRDLWCRLSREHLHAESPAVQAPSLNKRRRLSWTVANLAKVWKSVGSNRWPFHILQLSNDEAYDLASTEFASLAQSERHVLVRGWLYRSERLLQKHADRIREFYEIASHHRELVDHKIERCRQSSDVVIGIHIRQGDYKTFLGGRYYYTNEQYADVMRSAREQLSGQRVSFLVCGNGQFSASDFGDLDVHVGPGHMVEDMYALAETDALIGPPSTFTGWASFYGQTPLVSLERADQTFDLTAILDAAASFTDSEVA